MLFCTVLSSIGNCNGTDVCQYGVCHADGWSCRVTGSYGVDPTERHDLGADDHNTLSADDIEQTPLYNWCLVFLACACLITAATVAVAIQRKQKKLGVCIKSIKDIDV